MSGHAPHGREGGDGDALVTWLASRAAVAVLVLAATWTVAANPPGTVPGWLSRWDHWDVGLFVKIAKWGYGGYPGHYSDRGAVAFFPGEPLLLRAVHAVVGDWVAAGLLISLVAGAVASVALARLAAREFGGAAGARAVLLLVLSPYAVFLAAGYSEALFLAFALPAWLAVRDDRWAAAGALAALACAVRVTGAFLLLGLVVELLVHRRRVWRDGRWLLLPVAVLAGFTTYLHSLTGDWLAWVHAQRDWGRRFAWPWDALHTTWASATGGGQGSAYVWSFRAEIVAVAVGVVLTLALLATRRWGESAYVGFQVVAFASSSFYLSVGRASLLWWPLWVLLADASLSRRWVYVGYLALSAPLMAVLVVAFSVGHWVG